MASDEDFLPDDPALRRWWAEQSLRDEMVKADAARQQQLRQRGREILKSEMLRRRPWYDDPMQAAEAREIERAARPRYARGGNLHYERVPLKLSKASVDYTGSHGDSPEQCSKCAYYLSPTTCAIVAGRISPEGWCKRFSEQGYAEGGAVTDEFTTQLSPRDEAAFQSWKQTYAPHDSGEDYDLRGAFKAGLTPDPESGHWPDTFKKPNHPTFSDQSIYAKDRPDLAGHWDGDRYVPPRGKHAAGGRIKPDDRMERLTTPFSDVVMGPKYEALDDIKDVTMRRMFEDSLLEPEAVDVAKWRKADGGKVEYQRPVYGGSLKDAYRIPHTALKAMGNGDLEAGRAIAGQMFGEHNALGPDVVHPQVVSALGGGSLAAGRRVLEKFVGRMRAQHERPFSAAKERAGKYAPIGLHYYTRQFLPQTGQHPLPGIDEP